MKDNTRQSYTERMLKVLVFIQNNLDKELSLEELAGIACFSPYHFHRVFKGMVGEGLAQHIRRLRLQNAAAQLRKTTQSVTDLAFSSGYDNLESFIRAFRKQFGLAPSCYRQQMSFRAQAGEDGPDDPLTLLLKRRGQDMEVKIISQDEKRVAFVRHVGPYADCGPAWEKLCGFAGPRGLLGPQSKFIGLCHDDPEVTAPDKIRYDACLEVGGQVQPEGEVGVQSIPAGDYAMTLHKGPYETMMDTYAALCGQWAPESGREIADGPSIEVYLNDPQQTAPEQLLTEIYIPLQ